MNKILKNVFVILLLLVFILGFSKSYTSYSIDNLAFITAIGIDVSDSDLTKLKVTFQFTTSSNSSDLSESAQSKTSISSVEATSIDSAINLMNAHIGKELKLSHCKLIVFSEKLAQLGIGDIVYTLINNIQVRPNANIVISKCNSEYYLNNSNPSLENYVTKYYEIFPNSGKYTGYTTNATIGNFFYALTTDTCEPYAILGGVEKDESTFKSIDNTNSGNSPITSSRKTENIGLAVFKDDKLVGELSAIETLAFSIIRNDINTFMISIPNPDDTNKLLDVYLYADSNTSSSVSIINDTPYVKISTKFTGGVSSVSNDSKYLEKSTLDEISNCVNNYLESKISTYLYRTSKDLKSDINCLGKECLSKFMTWNEFENYSWEDKYKDAFFDVHVETNIKSGYLLTQT